MPAQCTMAWSSKPSVSTSIWRFLPLTFCPHHSHADRCKPPFFGAFHALAIDNGGGGAGFSFRLFAACDVERVMNAIQHTIALPPNEVVVDRAVRRKVLWKVAPLATGAQAIHHPVHDRTVDQYFIWWQCDGVLDRIHH